MTHTPISNFPDFGMKLKWALKNREIEGGRE